jgi:hypothetical protein
MLNDYNLAVDCAFTYMGAPPSWQNASKTIQVYLIPHGADDYVFAFMGTVGDKEWVADFEAVPVEARTINHAALGIVHMAWWQEVQEISTPMIAVAQNLQKAGKKLYCTGHSKGAANALLFAADAITQGIKWARVSTFGTPHAGALNGLITSELGSDYRNMNTLVDPVPDVPFYIARPRPLTLVNAPEPQISDPDFPLMSSHAIANYVAATEQGSAS